MTYNQKIGAPAEPQKNKTFLLHRMIRVINQQCVFVIKYGLSFLKSYFVFLLVNDVLVGIPFKI